MTSRVQILLTNAHAAVYRATGGRIGGRAGRLEQVLLTTRGRRTGKERTSPLAGVPHGSDLLLVASNGGADRHPAWFDNLVADPHVVVQRGGDRIPMLARVATEVERPTLWRAVTAVNPAFARYEQRTSRMIPVVVCTPEQRA